MSVRQVATGGMAMMFMLAATILGLLIHVWTIVIAFNVSGVFSAVVSLMFPFFAQFYWFFKVGHNVGYDSNYCVGILAYIMLWVGMLLFGALTYKD